MAWRWLNTYLTMRSAEWIPCFTLLVYVAFALSINCLHLNSLLALQFSPPPTVGEWVSGYAVLCCQLGLNHNLFVQCRHHCFDWETTTVFTIIRAISFWLIKTFFTVRTINHQNSLLRDMVKSPWLEVYKMWLQMVLSNFIQVPLPMKNWTLKIIWCPSNLGFQLYYDSNYGITMSGIFCWESQLCF